MGVASLTSFGIQFSHIPPPVPTIVGATYAAPAEFPYQLRLTDAARGYHKCGATLITAVLAITAAHCVDNGTTPSDVKVIAGGHIYSQWRANVQERAVRQIIIHEKYRTNITVQGHEIILNLNDIALLLLSQPFLLNKAVSAVPLPQDESTKFKVEASALGWFRTVPDNSTSLSDTLKMMVVSIVPVEDCMRDIAASQQPRNVGMLCVGGMGQAGPCFGGGPLVSTGDSGSEYLCGVGSTAAECGTFTYPSTYTNVAHHMGWIQSRISELSVDSSCGANAQLCAYSTVKNLCALDQVYCPQRQTCISMELRCSPEAYCLPDDYSYEVECQDETILSSRCISSEFECTISKKCISYKRTCNRNYDCGWFDVSDETDCFYMESAQSNCTADHFQCTVSKRCIPLWYVCDGDHDCGTHDTSDEDHCVAGSRCHLLQFQCRRGWQCIPAYYRCDGKRDCKDNSDEENCVFSTPPISQLETSVPPAILTTPSVPATLLQLKASAAPSLCGPGEFLCKTTNACIPSVFVCDEENDCSNGSDEVSCSGATETELYGPTEGSRLIPPNSDTNNTNTKLNCTGSSFECVMMWFMNRLGDLL